MRLALGGNQALMVEGDEQQRVSSSWHSMAGPSTVTIGSCGKIGMPSSMAQMLQCSLKLAR